MGRRSETAARRLLNEANSIEVLLSDIVPRAEDVEEYWEVSAKLLTLVNDLEDLAQAIIAVDSTDPLFLAARVRLSKVEAEIIGLERRATE